MITSIWLNKVSCGTELKVVQEGIPLAIPTEMCYLGWQESLEKLIKLVEPEITEG
ncbi:Ligand-binding SRPBCC domain protein family [Candidatus Nitrosotalea sp. FS]|nr:Ligand-binding SRPBCC domain protein family [Candidatus Nitrosotalea sp. FS]